MAAELPVDGSLVGRMVCNPARPEWGAGKVVRVQSATVGGRPVRRVSVQFATGHRVMVIPPGRLAEPTEEPEREAGWLEQVAGATPDDRLRQLPADLAGPALNAVERVRALAGLYELDEEPATVLKWARRQANVADPLSLWSRDELLVAFRAFCQERDSALRMAAAKLCERQGAESLRELLEGFSEGVREGVVEALRKPL